MADQKSIEQRVKEIIVNQLNVNEEQITPTASFLDDLGADSLDTVELIMAFEEEFKDEIKGEIPESGRPGDRLHQGEGGTILSRTAAGAAGRGTASTLAEIAGGGLFPSPAAR